MKQNKSDIKTFDSKTENQAGHIVSKKAPPPVGPYPHARRYKDLLFLSGVGPRQAGAVEIPGVVFALDGQVESYDVAIQTKAVIENIKVILEEAGSCLNNVLDVQVFLVNMKKDFHSFNEVYRQYFESVGATRTTVEVGALPTPIHVEFKVTAFIKD